MILATTAMCAVDIHKKCKAARRLLPAPRPSADIKLSDPHRFVHSREHEVLKIPVLILGHQQRSFSRGPYAGGPQALSFLLHGHSRQGPSRPSARGVRVQQKAGRGGIQMPKAKAADRG